MNKACIRQESHIQERRQKSTQQLQTHISQGSVLGPILFLAYINDLPDNITSQVRLFADDTVVYAAISRMDDSLALQRDLDTLQTWENKWDMEFNPSKCQVLQLTRARKPIPTSYYLHNQKLEITDCARYLGVDIFQNLSFNNHIDRICNTANKTLGFLRRNLKVNNKQLKTVAFQATVRPVLEYCSSCWDPYTQRNILKLEMVQRRAARWVKGDWRQTSSVTSMLQELNWRSLALRRACWCPACHAIQNRARHGGSPKSVLPTPTLSWLPGAPPTHHPPNPNN